MNRTKFTEEQSIGILKEAETGAKIAELARRHAVSEVTICNWKAKYGGLEVSEAKRLRALAAERRRFGCRRLHILLRRDGVLVNRKGPSGSTPRKG